MPKNKKQAKAVTVVEVNPESQPTDDTAAVEVNALDTTGDTTDKETEWAYEMKDVLTCSVTYTGTKLGDMMTNNNLKIERKKTAKTAMTKKRKKRTWHRGVTQW
jgi:hypothetical protein